MRYTLENCANGAISALNAQKGGADRVELCAGMPEGGTTPSIGEVRTARKLLDKARLHVIVRPRGGDFLYNDIEKEMMLEDIREIKAAGADGVVLGMLSADGEIDIDAMRQMMKAAQGMSVTFHRAFDVCADPIEALETLIEMGCDRVLTSGQESTAVQGIPLLKRLVRQAERRIIVMPGCGITAENIAYIAQETGATEFHLSARSKYPGMMRFRHERVSMGGTYVADEYAHERTDILKLQAAREALQNMVHKE